MAGMYGIGLQGAGIDLTVARDWPTGCQLLRVGRFDLVLLDVVLPGPSGMEALEEIRANPETRHLPVAILSNSEMSPEVHLHARKLKILAWLTKSKRPPPQVARSIRRWLKAAELTPEHRRA